MTKEWHCGIPVTGAFSKKLVTQALPHHFTRHFPKKEGGLLTIKEMTLL
ncbi:MAG: hypothetical protein ACK519_08200 [Sphingomonadaceae bacterium]